MNTDEEQLQKARNFMNMATDVVFNEPKMVTYNIGTGGLPNSEILHWGRLVQRCMERLELPVPEPEKDRMAEFIAAMKTLFAQQDELVSKSFKRKFYTKKFGRNWYVYATEKLKAKAQQIQDPDNLRNITHSTAGSTTFFKCEGQTLSTAQLMDILDYAVQRDLLHPFYSGQLVGMRKRALQNVVNENQEKNDAQDASQDQ